MIFAVKPTTKAKLALNGLFELARMRPAKPLALSQLAEKQAISLSYLEQVFASLRRNGLVLSVRGPGGGYLLAKPADKITTGDIISAVNGSSQINKLWQKESEQAYLLDQPIVQQIWALMSQRVARMFHQVSLHYVMDGNLAIDGTDQKMAPQAAE